MGIGDKQMSLVVNSQNTDIATKIGMKKNNTQYLYPILFQTWQWENTNIFLFLLKWESTILQHQTDSIHFGEHYA